MTAPYIITTHAQLPGVGLSKPGHWSNLRYDTDALAVAAAEADARGPCAIERRASKVRLA